MQTVFMIANKNDNIYTEVAAILKRYGFSIIDSDRVFIAPTHRIAVRIDPGANVTANDATVLILNSDECSPPRFCGQMRGICESANHYALKVLKSCNISAVICGMSKTDTITFSSITDDRALISVQRRLKNINGKILEPCEISVNLKHRYSNSAVICACALLIISDIKIREI